MWCFLDGLFTNHLRQRAHGKWKVMFSWKSCKGFRGSCISWGWSCFPERASLGRQPSAHHICTRMHWSCCLTTFSQVGLEKNMSPAAMMAPLCTDDSNKDPVISAMTGIQNSQQLLIKDDHCHRCRARLSSSSSSSSSSTTTGCNKESKFETYDATGMPRL